MAEPKLSLENLTIAPALAASLGGSSRRPALNDGRARGASGRRGPTRCGVGLGRAPPRLRRPRGSASRRSGLPSASALMAELPPAPGTTDMVCGDFNEDAVTGTA